MHSSVTEGLIQKMNWDVNIRESRYIKSKHKSMRVLEFNIRHTK